MFGHEDGRRHGALRLNGVARAAGSVRDTGMTHRPTAAPMLAALLPAVALCVVALPAAASAAERRVYIASFEKVRVQGPFEVRIATGAPAAATLSGDRAVIDAVEVQGEGATLVLRSRIRRWQDQPRGGAGTPVVVTLSTQALVGASVLGAGRVSIDTMKGDRVDLSVAGGGTIAVAAAMADAVDATLIGGGAIAIAGRAGKVRLMTNGPGAIDAHALDAGELVVRVDGPGATTARARYTASVIDTGLGQVTVAGHPKCTVKADAGGPVTCGSQP
jgi:hypothetical protein